MQKAEKKEIDKNILIKKLPFKMSSFIQEPGNLEFQLMMWLEGWTSIWPLNVGVVRIQKWRLCETLF